MDLGALTKQFTTKPVKHDQQTLDVVTLMTANGITSGDASFIIKARQIFDQAEKDPAHKDTKLLEEATANAYELIDRSK